MGGGPFLGSQNKDYGVGGCAVGPPIDEKNWHGKDPPNAKVNRERVLLQHGVLDKKHLNEGDRLAINSPS